MRVSGLGVVVGVMLGAIGALYPMSSGGDIVGDEVGVCAFTSSFTLGATLTVNMSASFWRLACVSVSSGWKGTAGCGLRMASVNCLAASMRRSKLDVAGTGTFVGKNSTVSTMRSARVCGK